MSHFEPACRLSELDPGDRAVVVRVLSDDRARADRLAALGVTHGALVRMLQTFPGLVFECDETEIAIEPSVARTVLVRPETS